MQLANDAIKVEKPIGTDRTGQKSGTHELSILLG
jgi:hypothetical protein